MNRAQIQIIAPIFIILIALSGITVVYVQDKNEPLKGEANFQLSYRYLVINQGPINLTSLSVRLAVLKDWDPVQRVDNVVIGTQPNYTSTDEYDNQFVNYEYDSFTVGQTLDIQIDVNLTLNILDYTGIDFGDFEYDTNSEEYKMYTAYNPLIDTTDLRIQQVANRIAGRDYIESAFNAYNFTVNYLQYKLISESKGASFAISRGYGDCDEYQSLFQALARSNGIPTIGFTAWFAEFQTGFVTTDEGAASHAYPMIYVPNYGLLPVDPTRGKDDLYNNWLKTDEKRITLTKGDIPYRLLRYRWVPVEGLSEPDILNNYTISIQKMEVNYFSSLRQVILFSLALFPIIFVITQIIRAKKIRKERQEKLEKMLNPELN